MAHKRNGKAARQRRQESAKTRKAHADQIYDLVVEATPEERLLTHIFGVWETCDECGSEKVVRHDCQTPHCKALRDEKSVFYEEITEDYIRTHGGAIMEAGIDY